LAFRVSWELSKSTMWATGYNIEAAAEVNDQIVKFLRTVNPA
jgi:hypothetical protein